MSWLSLSLSKIVWRSGGGWHFTNIKTPEDIEKKLLNYTHHYEFELSGLNLEDLRKKVEEKKAFYDLNVDQRASKFNKGQKLTLLDLNHLPIYIQNNIEKYKLWLD